MLWQKQPFKVCYFNLNVVINTCTLMHRYCMFSRVCLCLVFLFVRGHPGTMHTYTLNLENCVYLLSIISQFLDFMHCMVFNLKYIYYFPSCSGGTISLHQLLYFLSDIWKQGGTAREGSHLACTLKGTHTGGSEFLLDREWGMTRFFTVMAACAHKREEDVTT